MATVTDPVCGMQVDDKTAKFQSNYQGRTYFFCSEDCKRKFNQNPQQYAGRR